jgi:ABC-type glycerol-3-phosphate transport system substrate-binding protein
MELSFVDARNHQTCQIVPAHSDTNTLQRMNVPKNNCRGLIAIKVLSLILAVASTGVPRAKAVDFDWKQARGTTIHVAFTLHPYADAIIEQLPKFKELTGIDVEYELTPEESYFDEITTKFSAGTGEPDVFMTGVYQMWDYATAYRLEPLDDMLNDASLTSPDYHPEDFFEGLFNAGKWNLKPGSPPGSGNLWSLPLGFELYCLAYNKKYFDEKASRFPQRWMNWSNSRRN